jgi:hypothetical protein
VRVRRVVAIQDELLQRYLPPELLTRLPPSAEASWCGRVVLAVWAIRYLLEMAWVRGMDPDPADARHFMETIARLDDQRLVDQLEATRDRRGDGSHLAFVSVP